MVSWSQNNFEKKLKLSEHKFKMHCIREGPLLPDRNSYTLYIQIQRRRFGLV